MRKIFNFMLMFCFLTALGVGAAEIKDIAYYEKDFSRQGNIEELQERCKLDLKFPDTKNFPVFIWFHASAEASPMILFCGDPAVDWPARVEENQLLAARLQYVYKHKNVKMVSIRHTGHVNCRYPALSMINNMLLNFKE